MSQYILSEKIGSVLKITLNRPDKYNSFVREMALALQSELDKANKNPEIRAVYLTGNGKAFLIFVPKEEAEVLSWLKKYCEVEDLAA